MEHQFLIKCYILSSLIFLQRKKFVVLVSALLFCILFIDPHQAVRIPGTQKYWICKWLLYCMDLLLPFTRALQAVVLQEASVCLEVPCR